MEKQSTTNIYVSKRSGHSVTTRDELVSSESEDDDENDDGIESESTDESDAAYMEIPLPGGGIQRRKPATISVIEATESMPPTAAGTGASGARRRASNDEFPTTIGGARPARAVKMFACVIAGLRDCLAATHLDIDVFLTVEKAASANFDSDHEAKEARAKAQQAFKQRKAAEVYVTKLRARVVTLEALQNRYTQTLHAMMAILNTTAATTGSITQTSSFHKSSSAMRAMEKTLRTTENELEARLGCLRYHIRGLVGFSRLCVGDRFEVSLKHGLKQKWNSIVTVGHGDTQKWHPDPPATAFKALLEFTLGIKVAELNSLSRKRPLGSRNCDIAHLFTACPQVMTVSVNEFGSLQLHIIVSWCPLAGSPALALYGGASDPDFVPLSPETPNDLAIRANYDSDYERATIGMTGEEYENEILRSVLRKQSTSSLQASTIGRMTWSKRLRNTFSRSSTVKDVDFARNFPVATSVAATPRTSANSDAVLDDMALANETWTSSMYERGRLQQRMSAARLLTSSSQFSAVNEYENEDETAGDTFTGSTSASSYNGRAYGEGSASLSVVDTFPEATTSDEQQSKASKTNSDVSYITSTIKWKQTLRGIVDDLTNEDGDKTLKSPDVSSHGRLKQPSPLPSPRAKNNAGRTRAWDLFPGPTNIPILPSSGTAVSTRIDADRAVARIDDDFDSIIDFSAPENDENSSKTSTEGSSSDPRGEEAFQTAQLNINQRFHLVSIEYRRCKSWLRNVVNTWNRVELYSDTTSYNTTTDDASTFSGQAEQRGNIPTELENFQKALTHLGRQFYQIKNRIEAEKLQSQEPYRPNMDQPRLKFAPSPLRQSVRRGKGGATLAVALSPAERKHQHLQQVNNASPADSNGSSQTNTRTLDSGVSVRTPGARNGPEAGGDDKPRKQQRKKTLENDQLDVVCSATLFVCVQTLRQLKERIETQFAPVAPLLRRLNDYAKQIEQLVQTTVSHRRRVKKLPDERNSLLACCEKAAKVNPSTVRFWSRSAHPPNDGEAETPLTLRWREIKAQMQRECGTERWAKKYGIHAELVFNQCLLDILSLPAMAPQPIALTPDTNPRITLLQFNTWLKQKCRHDDLLAFDGKSIIDVLDVIAKQLHRSSVLTTSVDDLAVIKTLLQLTDEAKNLMRRSPISPVELSAVSHHFTDSLFSLNAARRSMDVGKDVEHRRQRGGDGDIRQMAAECVCSWVRKISQQTPPRPSKQQQQQQQQQRLDGAQSPFRTVFEGNYVVEVFRECVVSQPQTVVRFAAMEALKIALATTTRITAQQPLPSMVISEAETTATLRQLRQLYFVHDIAKVVNAGEVMNDVVRQEMRRLARHCVEVVADRRPEQRVAMQMMLPTGGPSAVRRLRSTDDRQLGDRSSTGETSTRHSPPSSSSSSSQTGPTAFDREQNEIIVAL